jgi:hypothetical protein
VHLEIFNAIQNLQARRVRSPEWGVRTKVAKMAVLHMRSKMFRTRKGVYPPGKQQLAISKAEKALSARTQGWKDIRVDDVIECDINSGVLRENSPLVRPFT